MKKLLFLLFLLIFTGGNLAWAIDERQVTRKADRLSRSKNWEKAEDLYNEALQQSPDSAVLNYNKGVVSYRKGDFDNAKISFTKSLATDNKALEAASSYNIGDALFKKSKQLQNSNVNAAIDALKQSLRYYGRALELSPRDKDARYNYELADKVLKVLLQQKPPQGGGGAQNKQGPEQKQNQQSQQKEQNGPQQQTGQEKDKEKENEQQREGAPPGIPDSEQKPQGGAEAQQTGDHLSKEEARMLVGSYGEEGPRQEINREQIPNEKAVEKNW